MQDCCIDLARPCNKEILKRDVRMQVGRPIVNSIAENSDTKQQYKLRRLADAWRYGSGSDYNH